MAGEMQLSFQSGKTVYCLVRNRIGQIWNTVNAAFEAYLTASYANFVVSATEQGTASAFYTATFPSAIPAGVYGIVAKQQLAGSAAETDPTIADGEINWNGSVSLPLSDLATSGQVGQVAPIRIARAQQILNFPFKLVSSADHLTAFTSGVVSGQISRDGGAFGALQSGNFAEIGLGFYRLSALTSGDLLANSVALVFTAAGISGGTADQRDFSLILQRISGF